MEDENGDSTKEDEVAGIQGREADINIWV